MLRGGDGATIGGLWGSIALDWLQIELLFVPEEQRGKGLGSTLIQAAEDAASEKGCRGVWLDTFSFQAKGFYEKLGYRQFGEIEGHPVDGTRHFLKKLLDQSSAA